MEKIIVTAKVKLSKSFEDSLEFHNQLFTEEHIQSFKAMGNVGHRVYLNLQENEIMAVDTWEVEDLKIVESFYNSEDFKSKMAGQFSEYQPELIFWKNDNRFNSF